MPTLLELAAEIVSSHASTTPMTTEELIQELRMVHDHLKALEIGVQEPAATAPEKKTISLKEAFKKTEVICMECGQGGFRTLTRHLKSAHQMTPREYRKKFGIPSSQSLSARSLTELRRKNALERNLSANLSKAHQALKAKREASVAKPSRSKKQGKK
ncbi:MAG: MucR family transcriptional regulator [Desulfuromonadia bacterium]